jgi:hypothetical protein
VFTQAARLTFDEVEECAWGRVESTPLRSAFSPTSFLMDDFLRNRCQNGRIDLCADSFGQDFKLEIFCDEQNILQ